MLYLLCSRRAYESLKIKSPQHYVLADMGRKQTAWTNLPTRALCIKDELGACDVRVRGGDVAREAVHGGGVATGGKIESVSDPWRDGGRR